MTERDIERKLRHYAHAMGSSRRRDVTRHPSRLWLGWAAASALLLMAAIALWPHDATAGALQRYKETLSDVRTMRIRSYTQKDPALPMRLYMTTEYKDGVWRRVLPERFKNVEFISTGSREYVNFRPLEHATVQDAKDVQVDSAFAESDSILALDYIESYVKGQPDSAFVTRQDGKLVNGRSTYKLVFSQPEAQTQAVVVIDQESGLPLFADKSSEVPASRVLGQPEGARVTLRAHHEFEFNVDLPDLDLPPDFGKPIVDVDAMRVELRGRWAAPLAEVDGTWILDACRTPDGLVWVTCAVRPGADSWLPDNLEGYAPLPEEGEEGPPIVSGRQILVTGLAPLVGPGRTPDRVDLPFVRRPTRYGWGEKPEHAPDPQAARRTVTLDLRVETHEFPLFFAALGLDYECAKMPMTAAGARATFLEARNRYEEAAKWWEASAKGAQRWVPYTGFPLMANAARCYRSAGLATEALRAEKEAERLKALR